MRKKKKENYIFHFSSHFLSAHSLSIFIQQVVSSMLICAFCLSSSPVYVRYSKS